MTLPSGPGETIAVLAFWVSVLLILYGYLGYPLLIHVLSRVHGRPNGQGDILPSVSLVVPAYNEAQVIKAKIENCLELDYPKDRLEVLVASDGSTDGTAEIIRDAARAGTIRAVTHSERRGKAAVINDLVRLASGKVVVFSDASSMLERGSVRALVSNFADPRVGSVSGVYRVIRRGRDSEADQESIYWRYETFIRLSEARLGSMLGAHGSLYAIRRELFEALDTRVINDDFVIPMMIVVKGFRSIYDTRAVAWEDADQMAGFSRRIRIMTGNYQQMILFFRKRLWFHRPRLFLQLLSHKGLRIVTPGLLLTAYASSAWLLPHPEYSVAFAVQTLFFAAALSGLSARARRLGTALVAGPYYFCALNAAAVVGFYRIVCRKGRVAWKVE
jgi:cellulose synthase/poly-beta-1,6-N-acetylglucosamine synthase-like glycosyltransferase